MIAAICCTASCKKNSDSNHTTILLSVLSQPTGCVPAQNPPPAFQTVLDAIALSEAQARCTACHNASPTGTKFDISNYQSVLGYVKKGDHKRSGLWMALQPANPTGMHVYIDGTYRVGGIANTAVLPALVAWIDNCANP